MNAFLGKLRSDPAWLAIGVFALAFFAVFLIWPLTTVFRYSVMNEAGEYTLEGYRQFFSDASYRESLTNTVILGLSVTATSLVVGSGLALVV